ncbi:MAG: DMT family transporter, partial [Dongiaceae bacterium]
MTRRQGTLSGFLGAMMWSCYGVLVVSVTRTPPFLALAIIFTCACAALLARRAILGHGFADLLHVPPSTLALGVLGLFGANCLYILALRVGGAPVTVNIAAFSWPILMVLIAVAFRLARATWLDGAALLLGFAGVVALTLKKSGFEPGLGFFVALLGALCWALYSAFRKSVPPGPRDSMVAFTFASAAVAWIVAATTETLAPPPALELLFLAIIGAVTVGIANLLWDHGALHGDSVLLAGLSFIEPVISTSLIVIFLSQPVGVGDGLGLALILAAVGCSLLSDRLRRKLGYESFYFWLGRQDDR